MYYIQNKNAGFMGNAPVWWAKGSNGYTSDLNNAEKFTREEAKKICEGNPNKNVAYTVEYIDNNKGIQRVIDCQYMSSANQVKF